MGPDRIQHPFHLLTTLIISLVLVGCVANPAQPNAEQGTTEKTLPQPEAEQSKPVAEEKKTASLPVSSINQSVEQLANRITAVQEQLIGSRSQVAMSQEQNQLILSRLVEISNQLQILQASAPAEPEPNELSQQLNPLTDQIAMLVSSMNQSGQVGPWELVSCYTESGAWVLLRYDRFTGLSWLAQGGAWLEIKEKEPLPPSDYLLLLQRGDKNALGYVAARIDRRTGKTWWLNQNSWTLYGDQG